MGNASAHIITAFLHHERKNEEEVTLTSVTTPPRLLYYINTLFSLACLSCKGEIIY